MKQLFFFLIFATISLLTKGQMNVGANTAPDNSAMLQVSGNAKGFLPPRLTTTQRNAITTPALGLTIYNTTTNCLNFYRPDGWYDPCAVAKAQSGTVSVDTLYHKDFSDSANCIRKTSDGGYIIAGTSIAHEPDFYILKIDAAGGIVWSKTTGASSGSSDMARSVQQTTDGGYIVAGYTLGGSSNHGGYDYYVVKLDALGNIIDSALLGGSGNDYAQSIRQTPDGGYIVAGYSSSSATGNVSGTNHGGSDYWIIKLSRSLDIIWDKLFGSSANELAQAVELSNDGGYVITGSTSAVINVGGQNGDVTGPTHSGSSSMVPIYDWWTIKLNSSGSLIWNEVDGGLNDDYAQSIYKTFDGSYAVVGSMYTRATTLDPLTNRVAFTIIPDTGPAANSNDVLTLGAKTNANSYAAEVQQTADGGFIIAGYTNASASGDVTDANHGGYDYWIIKLDAGYGVTWNKLFGGNKNDYAKSIRQTSDGGYIVAGYSFSSASGDVTSYNPELNSSDTWVIKLNSLGYIVK